ncbi:TPA: acyltransferase family protein, partial [Streptococcus pneumoniae]
DTLFVKVSTLGIFLTIFTLTLNENRNKWIVFLSNQTMGVFIIHTYIMKLWERIFGFNFVGAYLLFALFTLSVSFIIVGMLMKIPYFNRIVKL